MSCAFRSLEIPNFMQIIAGICILRIHSTVVSAYGTNVVIQYASAGFKPVRALNITTVIVGKL